MKVIHVIPSLNSGGAETMLCKLLKNNCNNNFEVEVVTLLSGGFYAEQIKELNIPIHELNLKNEKNPIKVFFRILKVLKGADIIQSWMYHSDLIAFVVGKVILRKKVIWGIRRSYLNKELMKRGTYFTAKLCALFSKYVDGIISCTIVGKGNHEEFGYSNTNFIVIPNGFDIGEYSDKHLLPQKTQKRFKLLNVARWEPLKDHETLLSTARILIAKGIQFELQLVGTGIEQSNKKLVNMIEEFNLNKEVQLLGVRKDIPELMRTSDIYVSSSISEGFPNVIGEAMASELYCVATDAGDTKYILDEFGIIVPIKDPEKLAEAILHVINMDDDDLMNMKFHARKRIEEEFSIQRIVKQYEEMYQKIANK